MRLLTIDETTRGGHVRGRLLYRRWFLHDTPRLMPACRIVGHRLVVDGTSSRYGRAARWVCCDRCGVRPDPQGSLDPDQWHLGQRYTGPMAAPARSDVTTALHRRGMPGPMPTHPTGTVGAELIIGRGSLGWSVGFKIGNAGSEHTLAAHITLGPLGALFVHTERHGTWLQRRLNPTSYQSRVCELAVHHHSVWWKVWAKRGEWSRDTPRWQDGSLSLDLVAAVCGPRRYTHEDVGDPVTAAVTMPHGDQHQVTLQLQRETLARKRWSRPRRSWCVRWDAKPGIPDGKHDGGILSSGVDVTDTAVEDGCWQAEAVAGIVQAMTRMRTRYGMRIPTGAGLRGR